MSGIYLTEIARAPPERINLLFRKTTVRFTLMAGVVVLPIAFMGGPLFAFVFGSAWYTAGTITQILIPAFVARFVVGPVSQTLNVLRRQDLHLFSAVLEGTAMILASPWAGTLNCRFSPRCGSIVGVAPLPISSIWDSSGM